MQAMQASTPSHVAPFCARSRCLNSRSKVIPVSKSLRWDADGLCVQPLYSLLYMCRATNKGTARARFVGGGSSCSGGGVASCCCAGGAGGAPAAAHSSPRPWKYDLAPAVGYHLQDWRSSCSRRSSTGSSGGCSSSPRHRVACSCMRKMTQCGQHSSSHPPVQAMDHSRETKPSLLVGDIMIMVQGCHIGVHCRLDHL